MRPLAPQFISGRLDAFHGEEEDPGMGWSSVFSLAERELNVTQREEPHTRHVEQERQAKPSQACRDRSRSHDSGRRPEGVPGRGYAGRRSVVAGR